MRVTTFPVFAIFLRFFSSLLRQIFHERRKETSATKEKKDNDERCYLEVLERKIFLFRSVPCGSPVGDELSE